VASLTSTSFDLSGVPSLQSRTNTTQFRFYVYDNSTVTTKVLRARVDNISAAGSMGAAKKLGLFIISAIHGYESAWPET
jgi:hypothetical protein